MRKTNTYIFTAFCLFILLTGCSKDAETSGASATPTPTATPNTCNEFSGFCEGPTVNISFSPVDPNDIKYVSKFYSCNGHAYPDVDSPNSGKHYFYPVNAMENTNDELPVYAACSGTVRMMTNDEGENPLPGNYGVRGRRFHLFCDSSSTALEYFHINFEDSLLETHVNAGDLLGHADTRVGGACAPDQCSNFDIAMADGNDSTVSSIFDRMNTDVAALWSARGITSSAVVTRDPAPTCNTYGSDVTNTDNWFQLTSKLFPGRK